MSSTITTPAANSPEPEDHDATVVDMTKRIPALAAPVIVTAPATPGGSQDPHPDDVPLLPAWLTDKDERRAARRRAQRHAARAARRWARRQKTERGHAAQAGRGLRRTHEWVIGIEGAQAQAAKHAAHAATREAKSAAKAARWKMGQQRQGAAQHAERATTAAHSAVQAHKAARRQVGKARLFRGVLAYGLPLAGDGAAYLEAGWPAALGLGAALFGAAAIGGRRHLSGETFTADDKRFGDGDGLSDDMLTRAFTAARIIGEGQQLRHRSPVVAVGEHAYQVTLDLPDGITVDKVRAAEAALAGALGIPRAQLDIRQAGAEGRLSLWASMVDPFAATVRSPLLDARQVVNSWRAGIPVGFDARGNLVAITISDYSLLLGGATRSGKGMGVANILAGGILDPRVNVRLFDGKGTGEYVPMAPVLATYVRRNPARLLAILRVLVEEMHRRADLLVEYGLSKLTEELIEEVGGIELLVVDELATYTASKGPSKEYAEEILELLAQIAAVGAAVGIVLVLATQFPEVEIVPSRLRGNCAGRWAMRTENADASNTILGKGRAGDGYNSADIPTDRASRGRGWLITPETGRPQMIRSLFIDESTGEIRNVIRIGQALRKAARRLPGQFADPVEAALLGATGASSSAGGETGNGGIIRSTLLDHLVRAADATGRGNLTNAEAYQALGRIEPSWARQDGETDAAYASRAGRAFKTALADLGIELDTAKLTLPDGTRPSGYTLATLRQAADSARNARG